MAKAVLASLDGGIGDPAETRIEVLDDGLLRGDGAFEMIKLYGGHPFRLGAHLDRLGRSAAAIELGFDRDRLELEIAALLERGGEIDAALRIVITRGGRRLLLLEELTEWPAAARIALIEVTPSEILAGVKSISYAANMQSTRIAAARGDDEAVWVHPDGTVLEAPTSSIFWVDSEGTLKTPELSAGILDSITREIVVAASAAVEGRFGAEDLRGAREAFLASTTREIQAVASIDGTELPEHLGPATAGAAELLAAEVERERARQ